MTDENKTNNKINSSLMFMAGIILVIIAGLTFVTTSWQVLSGFGKIGVMCVVTAIFFGSSIFAMKIKLNNTGNALYTLACFFATLTVLGCGWFEIFGEWFSFQGLGRMFLFAVTAFVLMLSAFYGAYSLKHRPYGFIMWSALTVFVVCLIYGIKENMDLSHNFASIAISIYAFVMVLLQKFALNLENKAFNEAYHIFVMINTAVLAIISIQSKSFVPMAMFTVSWLNISLNDTEDMAGGLLSGISMFMAISWLINPEAGSDYIITISAFACALTFMSMGQLVNKGVLVVYKIISVIATGAGLVLCLGNIILDWDLSSQLGITILLLNNLFLIYRKNQIMKYVQPFVSTLFTIGIATLLYNNGMEAEYANVVVLVLQGVNFLITLKFTQLRSNLSDVILVATSGLLACVLATMGGFGYIALVIFVAQTLALIFENKDRSSAIALAYVFPHIVSVVLALSTDLKSEFELLYYIVLSAMTLCVIALNKDKFKHLENSLLTALCFYSVFYFVLALMSKVIYGLIFTIIWTLKAYMNKDKPEKISTFIAGVGMYITVIALWADNPELNLYILIISVPTVLMALSFAIKGFEKKLNLVATVLANISIYIMLMLINEIEMTEFVCGAIFALLTYAYMCYRGYNFSAFLPLIYVFTATIYEAENFYEPVAIGILYVMSIGINYLGSQFKSYQKIEYTAIMGIIPSIYLLVSGSDLIYGCVLSAVLLLLSAINSNNQFTKKSLLSGASFMLLIGLLAQNIVDIPNIINSEYEVALIMSFVIGLKIIWGGNKTFSMVIYFIGIACIFTLFVEVSDYGYLADGIILGLIGFVIMLSGFMVRKKKWFMLGMISLIFVSIYMTKDFWLSLGWWAYLLLVGIVLIIIAGVNEWKKRKE